MHILCYIYLQVHFFSLRNYFCHLPEISPQLNVSSRYLIIFETNQILRALFTAPKMADLVTLTEEILNGKLHFLCSESNLEDSFFCYFFQRINEIMMNLYTILNNFNTSD